MRPVYQNLHRVVYCASLSSHEKLLLIWRLASSGDFSPRLAVPRPPRPRWILYTDASTNRLKLRALLVHGDKRRPALRTFCADSASAPRSYLFLQAALIFGLELLAIEAFFGDRAPFIRGSCVWIYLDNINCLAALVRGDSNTAVVAVLVSRFWELAQRHNVCVSALACSIQA